MSESHYFTPIHLHSDLVWTVEAPAKDALQQKKKKEQWVGHLSLFERAPAAYVSGANFLS